MPGLNLKKIFKRKKKEEKREDDIPLPKEEGARDTSMQYVDSPSALDYPGTKSKIPKAAPEKKTKDIKPETGQNEQPKKGELPRCPKCGWATGFEDNSCMNCGFKFEQKPDMP